MCGGGGVWGGGGALSVLFVSYFCKLLVCLFFWTGVNKIITPFFHLRLFYFIDFVFFFYIFLSSFLFFQICCARPVLEILSLSDGVVDNRCTAEARNSASILSTLSFSL